MNYALWLPFVLLAAVPYLIARSEARADHLAYSRMGGYGGGPTVWGLCAWLFVILGLVGSFHAPLSFLLVLGLEHANAVMIIILADVLVLVVSFLCVLFFVM